MIQNVLGSSLHFFSHHKSLFDNSFFGVSKYHFSLVILNFLLKLGYPTKLIPTNIKVGQNLSLTSAWRQLDVSQWSESKIQQTKMLVTCQRFSEWFLFGLVWQYSSIQKNIIKVGAKSWMLTCSCHINLSLPFYTDPDSKRELNFCNDYLSLLYFWLYSTHYG